MLSGPSRDAQNGAADALVIFLHGYGADGNDLLGLADPLSQYLPSVKFLAPNAPAPCSNNPMGYQWFPISWLDGSTEEAMTQGAMESAALLADYLDQVAEEEGIAPERTVLVGFSQGTMMSLHVAPRRTVPLAGIVGFSGRLLVPEQLEAEIKSRPPVLLVHGTDDDVVPPSSTPEAADHLRAAGVPVHTHESPGVGHGIAPDGLSLALQFIAQVLDIELDMTER